MRGFGSCRRLGILKSWPPSWIWGSNGLGVFKGFEFKVSGFSGLGFGGFRVEGSGLFGVVALVQVLHTMLESVPTLAYQTHFFVGSYYKP